MSILLSVLSLVVLIIVHEWGHFIAGRICHASINEFSVGMGPLIAHKKGKKETVYSLRAIPLGGYCSFGQGDEVSLTDKALDSLPLYKRMFIFIAGPFMNILTAIILYFLIMSLIGVTETVPVVDSVAPGMPAETVLEAGDEIISINGVLLNGDSLLMSKCINDSGGETIEVTVNRNGEKIETKLTPVFNKDLNAYAIGIIQQTKTIKVTITEAFLRSVQKTGSDIKNIFIMLGGLITGRYNLSDLSGIVGVINYSSKYATTSTMGPFLSIMSLLSVNLGIMNMLPIPGLDGSKVLFGMCELVFRKKIPENVEEKLTMIGFTILILIFLAVTARDIAGIFSP